MGSERILTTYERVADRFALERDRSGFEAVWLERMLATLGARPRVLDLGCGTGQPIAALLDAAGARVTGVDGAPAMLAHFRRNLPQATAILADMRGLDLGHRFDGLLAWNSFFHLDGAEQRGMFPVFARHLRPQGRMLLTTGPAAGEPLGHAGGAEVYHCSLDPAEYRALMGTVGLRVLDFRPEDPDCRGHSVWLLERMPIKAPVGGI